MKQTQLICLLFLLVSCAQQKPVKAEYNSNQVKRVAVGSFEGQGGTAVAHEFVKQLLNAGFVVTEQTAAADAVLTGVVNDYRPSDNLLIFIGTATFPAPNAQSVEVINPIIGSASPTTAVAALGLPKVQMVSVCAGLEVSAKLSAIKTGTLLWANSASYESLTLPAAAQVVTQELTQNLRKKIPVPTSVTSS